MSVARVANFLWKQSAKGDWRSFKAASKCAKQTQKQLLQSILKHACPSQFAQRFGLSPDMSVEEFQNAVPITDYSEFYSDFVHRIHQGDKQVLTSQDVYRLVPTTGSSGKVKLIPYTQSLKKSFIRVVNTWIYDLACRYPQAFHGKSYWSVTPVVQQTFKNGFVPIGFDSDEDYLSPIGRLSARLALIDAPSFASCEQADSVIGLTALKLLSEPDLSLISVWSPTLLLNILNAIGSDQENLLRALSSGDASFVTGLESESKVRFKRSPKRARQIEQLMNSVENRQSLAKSIWPRLSLISCWGDAGSRQYLEQLKKSEPAIVVQAKGLLSTEGCVSFPMGTAGGHVPAIESTFLEFLTESSSDETLLLDRLEMGQSYEVIMTTFGGLYRYRTGDQIKVIDFHEGLPCFEFIGRTNQVIDLVGEKVPLQVLQEVTSRCLEDGSGTERFWVVAPVSSTPAYYRFYVSGLSELATLADEILLRLRQNPHFVNAESLGQMAKPEIRCLPDTFTIHSFHSLKSDIGSQLGALKESRIEYSARVVACLDRISQPLENYTI